MERAARASNSGSALGPMPTAKNPICMGNLRSFELGLRGICFGATLGQAVHHELVARDTRLLRERSGDLKAPKSGLDLILDSVFRVGRIRENRATCSSAE